MLRRSNPRIRPTILALLMGGASLLACSCNPIGPACEAALKANAVLLGTVTHVYPLTIFGFPLAWPFPTERRVTLAVKERYSGPTEATIEILTAMGCCACGMEFQRGQDYLVYAHRIPGTRALATGVCSRTSRAEDAASDLSYLRSLASSAPPAHIYGFVTANPWDTRRAEKSTEPLADVPMHLTSNTRKWVAATDSMGAYDFPMLPAGAFSLYPDLPRKLGGGGSRTISLHEHGCSQQILVAFEKRPH
jgi:hypothetical protein